MPYFRSYPRHTIWEQLTAWFSILIFAILLLGMAAAAFGLSLFLLVTEDFSWQTAVSAAVSGFFTFLFAGTFLSGFRETFHVRLVLLFDRRLGLKSLFTGGPFIAKNFRRLDEVALAGKMIPLSQFTFEDYEAWQKREYRWNSPEDGLATIDYLLKELPKATNILEKEKTAAELSELKSALHTAKTQNAKFILRVRLGHDKMITPMEYEGHRGSFN
jgi:hypothetical protein